MDTFKKYIFDTINNPKPEINDLNTIINLYPWFMAARAVRNLVQQEMDGRVLVSVQMGKYIAPFFDTKLLEESRVEIEYNPIDAFLLRANYKIVPQDDTPDYYEEEEKAEEEDEVISEELAEILEKQGKIEDAMKIYQKLSLLYPKKSAYFAEIITDLNRQKRQ